MGSGKNCSFVQYRTTTHTLLEIWPGFSSNRNLLIIELLLYFVAFFHIASLFSTWIDKEKVEVGNEKALELYNRNFFFHISAWFQCRNVTQKCNKTSCCIMAWSRQTFWFKLNFLLPKNESVLNILVYFLEQFQRFSLGLQPLKNL